MKKSKYLCLYLAAALLVLPGCHGDIPEGGDSTAAMSSETETTEPEAETAGLIQTIALENTEALKKNKDNPYYRQLLEKVSDTGTPMTWVFTGDSITANDNNYSGGFRNYTEIFESYLINDLHRTGDRIVNTAVSGRRASDITYSKDIGMYNPDVVYIQMGANDSFYTDRETSVFKATLRRIFTKVIDSGAIAIVAVSNPFPPAWSNKAQIEAFEISYAPAVRELADDMGLLLVDYFTPYSEFSPDSFGLWMNSDLLHPTRLGYLKYAQILINDLGLAVEGSEILGHSCKEKLTIEEPCKLTAFETDDFRRASALSSFKKFYSSFEDGFILMGGSNAVGETTSCITRRTLAQLLDNNNQKGRQQTFYGSLDDIYAHIPDIEKGQGIILMPEGCGSGGERLTGSDIKGTLINIIEAAGKNENPVLLVTPPANPVNKAADSENAAVAAIMKEIASERDMFIIDLNAYTEKYGDAVWYDENGILNYNGCIAAHKLIYRCTHT